MTCDLVIDVARSQLGYVEGKNNITKYSEDFDEKWPNFYNGSKGDGKTWGCEWCDIFVDWCFCTVFGPEKAMNMLYQPTKSCGAGCKYSANYYKQNKAFDKNPKPGDQIFFGRPGSESHTGLVIGVTNYSVTTIEGNSRNKVMQHTYSLLDANISGYGHPKYEDNCTIIGTHYSGTWPTLPKRGYFQKGDKGVNVCRLQEFLKWYDPTYLPKYGVDGDLGNETKTAVLSFQAREGLKQDGLFGKKSLAKAKEVVK